MPEAVLLNDCKIWLGGYDLTGACNKVGLKAGKAQLGNSRFGDTAETFAHGLQQIDSPVSGFYSAGSGEPDAVIWPRIDPSSSGDVSSWPLTFAPPYAPAAGAGADGNIAYTVRGCQFEYSLGAQHGQLLPFDLTNRLKTGAALHRQTIIQPKGLVSATTTGTGRQLGVLGSTQKLVTVLHVFAINGGSWVLTIESDDNSGFTTPTTRQTFTAVTTAANRLVVETNGPIATDDYWRAVLTKTGGTSITYAVLTSLENL